MASSAHPAAPRIWLTGASYGIGRSLAVELANSGARLALTARSEDKLQELATEIEAVGVEVLVLPGDVTDRESMQRVADAMRDAWGGIDVLIANAGTHVPTRVEAFDVDEYMDLMRLNYGGVLNCIEAVLPRMLEDGAGHIVGVSSLAGYRGVPGAAAYGATKSALIHFLESMRFDLAGSGVDVTIVNPGFVRTPLTDRNDFDMPFLVEPDRAARIIRRGIERRRREVSFPFPFNWFIKFLRVIPMPLYMLIMGMTWKRMKRD